LRRPIALHAEDSATAIAPARRSVKRPENGNCQIRAPVRGLHYNLGLVEANQASADVGTKFHATRACIPNGDLIMSAVPVVMLLGYAYKQETTALQSNRSSLLLLNDLV
jgi:hypothetical protein